MKAFVFFLIIGNVCGGLNEIIGNLFRLNIFGLFMIFIGKICFRKYAELKSTIKALKFEKDGKSFMENSKKKNYFLIYLTLYFLNIKHMQQNLSLLVKNKISFLFIVYKNLTPHDSFRLQPFRSKKIVYSSRLSFNLF